MRNAVFPLLAALLAGVSPLFAQNTPVPVKVNMEHYVSKKCVRTNCCVEMMLEWPVFSGGNAKAVGAINDSLRTFVYLSAQTEPVGPLRPALDSAAAGAYAMLKEQLGDMGEFEIGYSYELKSKVLLNNNRYASVQMDHYSFTGGAHGSYFTLLQTFDLNTGRAVALHDVIRDTVALRPLLEKEFLRQKTQPGEPAPKLSEILFEDFKVLPMPVNFAVTRKGVRFIYNPYDVAAYVFGQTDITLTWAQLGKLADRKKWAL